MSLAHDLMTTTVVRVEPDMSLADIGRVLVAGRHGGLPVVDDEERVVGMITESEVLGAVLDGMPGSTPVRDLMTNPVLVADELSPLEEVMGLLRDGRVRHLPIVRQERLVGIITPHDVLKFVTKTASYGPPADS